MSLRNDSVLAAPETNKYTNFTKDHKRYPPYGRKILQQRQAGNIPGNIIYVVFDWMLARKCTRIVIPDVMPYEGLNFYYLAGLPVTIAYRNKDAHKINTISQDILAVNPCYLAILALDLDKNASVLVKPYEMKKDSL